MKQNHSIVVSSSRALIEIYRAVLFDIKQQQQKTAVKLVLPVHSAVLLLVGKILLAQHTALLCTGRYAVLLYVVGCWGNSCVHKIEWEFYVLFFITDSFNTRSICE